MIGTFIIFILIEAVLNSSNYEYRRTSQFSLIPSAFKINSFDGFYLPNDETYLIEFSNYVKIVNINEPELELESYNVTKAYFFFGREVSLLNDYGSSTTKVIKSYQYPDKRIQNMFFDRSTLKSIAWVNSSTAIIANQFSSDQYLGIYKAGSDMIEFKNLTTSTSTTFKSILILLEDDAVVICENQIYIIDLISFKTRQYFSRDRNFEITCFKTNSISIGNKIIQYLLFRHDLNNDVSQYKRELVYDNGNIISRTNFQQILIFKDLSYKCAYNFIDQNRLLLMSSSSNIIIRSLLLPDLYIGSFSTKLIKNSIKFKNSDQSYIKDGNLQILDYNNLSIRVDSKIFNNLTNQLKAWKTKTSKLIVFSNNQISFKYDIQGILPIRNLVDCQVIDDNILFYVTTSKLLIAYDFEKNSNISSIDLSKSNYRDLQMELVRQPNRNFCLLVITNSNNDVEHQVWHLTSSTSPTLEKIDSYSHPVTFKRTVIPSALTFYIEEDIKDGQPSISIVTLDNKIVLSSLKVPKYKWLKVIDTAFVIYLDDGSQDCHVYRFTVDAEKQTLTVLNQDKPVTIKLHKMSDSVNQNQVFLIKDLRENALPDNFLIFFYDQSNSYYYNALDPVLYTKKLEKYAFSQEESKYLMINPQIIKNRIYFGFSNNSFVRISLNPKDLSIYQQSRNFQQIFKRCKSISMKLLKQGTLDLIGFTCPSQTRDILIIYKQQSIIQSSIDRYKLMIYQKMLLDYDINENGDIAIINVKDGNDYLDYYKNQRGLTIPVAKDNFLCRSQNGFYLVFRVDSNIFLIDLIANITIKIEYSPNFKPTCTVDNAGAWIIFYRIQSEATLTVYSRNAFFKNIFTNHLISLVKFVTNKIFVRTTKDVFYIDDIILGNVIYLCRNTTQGQFTLDFNKRQIAYSFTPSNYGYYNVNICELGFNCFSSFLVQPASQFKIQNNGKLIVLTNSTSRVFFALQSQLKYCDKGQYISNGQCKQCASDCSECQAQTGACLDCSYGTTYLVFIIILPIVVAGLIFLLIRNHFRSKKLNHSLLTEQQRERQVLNGEIDKLKRQNTKLKQQNKSIKKKSRTYSEYQPSQQGLQP